ncbi:CsgG/HfaB family protein, partial [Hoeflea sp.]|uniref:CsgG/HfaB family protein n=1 Tax=Hoeflea sp. TaxID=1940281 RepID=UPI002AFF98A3
MSIKSRIETAVRGGRKALVICAVSVGVSGCVTQEAFVDTPPSVGVVSRPNDDLRRLPQPEQKTVVAVYAYNDLTGQYKERDNVQSLSRAVTQGGAPMLVKALQDAGEGRWFTVVERAQLDNLLRERQILTEMRRIYRNETKVNAGVLPPLMHASIIVEGGIIGYDTNTITGGAGARFLNIGANTKYIQDVVTVTLRAVSIKSGEVLATVTARKAVASYALQGGAFRYLKLDELLEAEAGITYNEPKQIATESAIESAVKSLIIEGTMVGVWSFADEEAGREIVANYL